MSIHNYDEDAEFNKEARPAWLELFSNIFDTDDIVNTEDDPEYQKTKNGDYIINAYSTIEVKTRKEWVYERYADEILFEVMGNVELRRSGSAFLDSKADYYAYGFLIEDEIVKFTILHMSSTQMWFSKNKNNYRSIFSNNVKYKTESKIVPLKNIPNFCFVQWTPKEAPITQFRPQSYLDNLFWSK